MKIASILAGVAIAALSASAASAQAVQVINKGQYTNNSTNIFGVITPGSTVNVPSANAGPFQAGLESVANAARALDGGNQRSAWHAAGFSAGDVGTVGNDGATFSLKGAVTKDCVYYSGDNDTESFDFGTLGIYAGDNTGPNAAFTMVAPAVLSIQTNLAGCNTNNTVTLSRTVADMTSDSNSGFDNSVFTNKLPYSVTASYQGASQVAGGGAAIGRTLTMAAGDLNEAQANGAWKSPMNLTVLVPTPSQALLAGNYTSSFSVLIAAQ
ncbi:MULTISPECIES: hypothetical protein [unclassified Brevundimonas]|uniref:hypothetical protein n=1 Tax=unclassified Brevundimonas TaxID=2622653 RepID=UPI0025C46488|nr:MULTISPECIES: hypothetical protein [unclassified Brevundimonas]